MSDLSRPVEVAEKREHRRLQQVERGRVGHRSVESPQDSLQNGFGGSRGRRQVEYRLSDALSQRRVLVDQLPELPIFEDRPVTGNSHPVRSATGALQSA